jgi:hypothetical protein
MPTAPSSSENLPSEQRLEMDDFRRFSPMNDFGMSSIGKTLIALGISLVIIGAVMWGASKLLGRHEGFLPGDIVYRRGNFTFAFPITTCILISVLLTLIAWLVSAFRR